MADGFDFSDLTRLQKDMLKLANETLPKESKKFLRKEGTKEKKEVTKLAKQRVKKDSGNYLKGIKRGKVYKYKNTNLSVRIYSSAPHAHLIEYGHRMVTEDGEEIGFVQGKHILKDAEREFEENYYQDCEKFIDDIIKGVFE